MERPTGKAFLRVQAPGGACLRRLRVLSQHFCSQSDAAASPRAPVFQLADTWDENEEFVSNHAEFLRALGYTADPTRKVMVVTVVGPFRVGKSYLMNHLFFEGEEVFETSSEAVPCTKGVWVAVLRRDNYDILVVDSEGTDALLSSHEERLKHVAGKTDGEDIQNTYDRLEDRVKTLLGVAMIMSGASALSCLQLMCHAVVRGSTQRHEAFTYQNHDRCGDIRGQIQCIDEE